MCSSAGGDRFGIYDVENPQGVPVYVHSKVVVIDDVWAMIGSDNLNRRSWTHDSELSCAVIDSERDRREPTDPAGEGDGARVFARDLRLKLLAEHLDRRPGDVDDLIDPIEAFDTDQGRRREAEGLARRRSLGPSPSGPAASLTCRRSCPAGTGSGRCRCTGPYTTRTAGP